VIVPEIPSEATGKQKRLALAAALGLVDAPGAVVEKTPFVAPRTPTEELIAGGFVQIPGNAHPSGEPIGIHDHIFRLGGEARTPGHRPDIEAARAADRFARPVAGRTAGRGGAARGRGSAHTLRPGSGATAADHAGAAGARRTRAPDRGPPHRHRPVVDGSPL